MVAGMRLARRIADTSAMRPYIRREVLPGESVSTDDELLDYIRAYGSTIFHPTSTCRMGQDETAVVMCVFACVASMACGSPTPR